MTDELIEQAPEAEAAEPANKAEAAEVTLYTFSNHSPAPELESLLAMFYKGAVDNQLGIMQALNTETNAEELLLVGVTVDNGDTHCYPLCTLLKAEDVPRYKAPNGKGGWFGDEQTVDEAPVEV
jgi:hypothetical protein